MPNAGSAIPPPMLAGFENAMDVAFSVVLNEMATQPTELGGKHSIVIPFEGNLTAYIVCDTTTVSSAGNFHEVTLTRNGHKDFPITISTDPTTGSEIGAFKQKHLGSIAHAGVGDVIETSVTVTGSPSPMLSSDNFTIRLVLQPLKKLTLVH
jgi:hypothetical protein